MPEIGQPAHAGPRGRILVVDDEPLVLRTISRVLERDHEVIALQEAAAALQRLRGGERFDVIFCDLMMPQMSGMDLYDQLRASDAAAAARMVFLSGGAFTDKAREFLDRVPNQRVEKPFDFRALRELVARMVAGRP